MQANVKLLFIDDDARNIAEVRGAFSSTMCHVIHVEAKRAIDSSIAGQVRKWLRGTAGVGCQPSRKRPRSGSIKAFFNSSDGGDKEDGGTDVPSGDGRSQGRLSNDLEASAWPRKQTMSVTGVLKRSPPAATIDPRDPYRIKLWPPWLNGRITTSNARSCPYHDSSGGGGGGGGGDGGGGSSGSSFVADSGIGVDRPRIVLWVTGTRRVWDNAALSTARWLAFSMNLPLQVCVHVCAQEHPQERTDL